ncbi:hypothetical protein [Microtetraspora malaysiensis]|uniref:Uncharacterized protein n=1 Tax=Microtetraspora malaysiensis TaxID=161358 RepID=A0ABW6SRG7_9ACTN
MLRGQEQQPEAAEQRAEQCPRVPPPEPARRTVRQRAGDRVGDQGGRRAEPGDHGEGGLLVTGGDLADLLGEEHLQRSETVRSAEAGLIPPRRG